MEKELYRRALEYHGGTRPGKIAVVPTKPYATQHDLALAYSPGVAAPCLEIARDPASSYDYTGRGNLVAVVTDGSAVLGLGDIGPEAAKPVMEGKCMLFKLMAGIDAFDLELDARDPDAFVETVCRLAPTFGAVNLEDIKAPECFEIERRLNAKLPIPVMHDDQHGTAVIVAAAVINALHLNGKRIETLRTVVSGAGAAAIASVRLLLALGIRREHLVLCDSRGVISVRRTDLNDVKREFATREPYDTLGEAIVGADLFLGVSRGGVLTPDMLRTMAPAPIVLALANPVPEIPYAEAVAARPDALVATGRSNDPNQVNNALCFPFLFRGALDVRATAIDDAMKLAAARAIADLARMSVPDAVLDAYGLPSLAFGPEYLIPKALDRRLLWHVAPAVARAAEASGLARSPLTDVEHYVRSLRRLVG